MSNQKELFGKISFWMVTFWRKIWLESREYFEFICKIFYCKNVWLKMSFRKIKGILEDNRQIRVETKNDSLIWHLS